MDLHKRKKTFNNRIYTYALYERYMYEIAQVIVYISYRALTLKDQDDLKKTPIFAEFKECFVKYLRGENDEES